MLFAFADQAQAYYSPTTGRFINRDPIGERGGENLHAFVSNNGINSWDIIGREDKNKKKKVTLSAKPLRLKIGKCGAFRYDFEWEVKGPKGLKGFIIQKLSVKSVAYGCGVDQFKRIKGGTINQPIGFEAWIYPGAGKALRDSWVSGDSALSTGEFCRGEAEYIGKANFVEGERLNGFKPAPSINYPEKPEDFSPFIDPEDPLFTADLTPGTINVNTFKPTSQSNELTTTLKATWNCCKGFKDTEITINGVKQKEFDNLK